MQNEPASPGAQPEAWTTPEQPFKSPVVSPSPGSQAPAPGGQPIYVGGDSDAGGRDDVAGSVAEAVSNAMARQAEHQTDTFPIGSQIGDGMTLPDVVSDWSKHTAGSDATSYDPAG